MASFDDGIPTKRRRLQGSCDICRKKKIRCDSAKMPGNVCSNCIAFGSTCTHELANRGKNKTAESYTGPQETFGETLNHKKHKILNDYQETRHKVAAILSPSNAYNIPDNKVIIRQTLVEISQYVQALEAELIAKLAPDSPDESPLFGPPTVPPGSYADFELLHDDDQLSEPMRSLNLQHCQTRFYGKSNDIFLVKAAIDIRKQALGEPAELPDPLPVRRPEYWTVHPWQWQPDEDNPPFTFPEPDLLEDLITLYFDNANPYLPIFHQPSFRKSVDEGLHLTDRHFGAVVLAICATGSRYSKDPRVIVEGAGEQSSGWKWFRQVRPIRRSFISMPSLYEVQLYCVCVTYLQGTSTPEACWILSGLAVRMVQDVGAHRKAPPEAKRTVETELWKRVFWAVICIDVFIASCLGRPRATHPDDYDQDLPLDIDDEYWEVEKPADDWKQPPGKPSKISYYIGFIKLLGILGMAQRSIYTLQKSDLAPNETKQQFDQQMILRIDSALNEWVDSLPAHMRWDPHREDPILFDLSAVLYATYYYVQILVHKPFIRLPDQTDLDNSRPSLAICANAARSCVHVMEIQSKRGFAPVVPVHIALGTSSMVLMLNHWSGRRMGLYANSAREYSEVRKCISIFRMYESRWQVAGRMCDLLERMVGIGTLQQPDLPAHNPLKRSRALSEEDDDSSPEIQLSTPSDTSQLEGAPPMAMSDLAQLFNLPTHTDELGRLPIHGSFNFTSDMWMSQSGGPVPLQQDASLQMMPQYASAGTDISSLQSFGSVDHQRLGDGQLLDAETTSVWSKTPAGFDWESWGPYFSSVEQFLHAPYSTQS